MAFDGIVERNLNLGINGLLDVVRDDCFLIVDFLDYVGDVGYEICDAGCVRVDLLRVRLD